MKVFIPQMLHIRLVKNIYSLAGACRYKSKRLFRPPNQIVLSQVESNEIFIQQRFKTLIIAALWCAAVQFVCPAQAQPRGLIQL